MNQLEGFTCLDDGHTACWPNDHALTRGSVYASPPSSKRRRRLSKRERQQRSRLGHPGPTTHTDSFAYAHIGASDHAIELT